MLSRADFARLSACSGERWPGTAASLLLHGAVLALIGLIWRSPSKPMFITEWPSVEIVDERVEAKPPPPASSPLPPSMPAPSGDATATAPAPATPPESARPPSTSAGATGVIRAERMLSQVLLSGPYGAAMKRELGRVDGETRLVQLCNIEAMAQIDQIQADGAHAQRVVAYARSVPKKRHSAIVAPGAAVDIRGRWVRLGYTCELAPDGKVTGFEFRLGAEIGPEDWERFSLPPPGKTALD